VIREAALAVAILGRTRKQVNAHRDRGTRNKRRESIAARRTRC